MPSSAATLISCLVHLGASSQALFICELMVLPKPFYAKEKCLDINRSSAKMKRLLIYEERLYIISYIRETNSLDMAMHV